MDKYNYYRLHEDELINSVAVAPPVLGGVRPRKVRSGKLGKLVRRLKRRLRKRTR